MRCSTWSASSSSISGPRRRRPGRTAGPISMRAERPHGELAVAAGNTAERRLDGGADQAVVDAPDTAGVERRLGAHHEQLAGAQGAGDLVGPGQQAAEAAGQRADRSGVGTSDEAHRPAGRRRSRARAVKTGAKA